MKTLLTVTIVLTVLLALAVAGGGTQPSKSDSTLRSTGERKPVAEDTVSPVKGGKASTPECLTGRPSPVEAPAPGVPIDRNTYRELKERAKGRR